MKVFNRANLPDSIKYNGKTYVFDAALSGRFSIDKTVVTKEMKVVFVDVLNTRLRNWLDLHNKPYKPVRFVFTKKEEQK